jgi:5-methylcytosine-specific restriction endonuclease McrBC regulatory subunit McrC
MDVIFLLDPVPMHCLFLVLNRNVIYYVDMKKYHVLLTELDQLLEDAPLPFIMQHAAKILGVRKRVSSLNSILKSIQHRVDNIDRMLSVGMLHGIF